MWFDEFHVPVGRQEKSLQQGPMCGLTTAPTNGSRWSRRGPCPPPLTATERAMRALTRPQARAETPGRPEPKPRWAVFAHLLRWLLKSQGHTTRRDVGRSRPEHTCRPRC